MIWLPEKKFWNEILSIICKLGMTVLREIWTIGSNDSSNLQFPTHKLKFSPVISSHSLFEAQKWEKYL